MQIQQILDIYETLTGVRAEAYRVPGVENLFQEGSKCSRAYEEISAAYERLRDRLGVVDEDDDVEIIINSLMEIEQTVSMKMFEYGNKLAQQERK